MLQKVPIHRTQKKHINIKFLIIHKKNFFSNEPNFSYVSFSAGSVKENEKKNFENIFLCGGNYEQSFI